MGKQLNNNLQVYSIDAPQNLIDSSNKNQKELEQNFSIDSGPSVVELKIQNFNKDQEYFKNYAYEQILKYSGTLNNKAKDNLKKWVNNHQWSQHEISQVAKDEYGKNHNINKTNVYPKILLQPGVTDDSFELHNFFDQYEFTDKEIQQIMNENYDRKNYEKQYASYQFLNKNSNAPKHIKKFGLDYIKDTNFSKEDTDKIFSGSFNLNISNVYYDNYGKILLDYNIDSNAGEKIKKYYLKKYKRKASPKHFDSFIKTIKSGNIEIQNLDRELCNILGINYNSIQKQLQSQQKQYTNNPQYPIYNKKKDRALNKKAQKVGFKDWHQVYDLQKQLGFKGKNLDGDLGDKTIKAFIKAGYVKEQKQPQIPASYALDFLKYHKNKSDAQKAQDRAYERRIITQSNDNTSYNKSNNKKMAVYDATHVRINIYPEKDSKGNIDYTKPKSIELPRSEYEHYLANQIKQEVSANRFFNDKAYLYQSIDISGTDRQVINNYNRQMSIYNSDKENQSYFNSPSLDFRTPKQKEYDKYVVDRLVNLHKVEERLENPDISFIPFLSTLLQGGLSKEYKALGDPEGAKRAGQKMLISGATDLATIGFGSAAKGISKFGKAVSSKIINPIEKSIGESIEKTIGKTINLFPKRIQTGLQKTYLATKLGTQEVDNFLARTGTNFANTGQKVSERVGKFLSSPLEKYPFVQRGVSLITSTPINTVTGVAGNIIKNSPKITRDLFKFEALNKGSNWIIDNTVPENIQPYARDAATFLSEVAAFKNAPFAGIEWAGHTVNNILTQTGNNFNLPEWFIYGLAGGYSGLRNFNKLLSTNKPLSWSKHFNNNTQKGIQAGIGAGFGAIPTVFSEDVRNQGWFYALQNYALPSFQEHITNQGMNGAKNLAFGSEGANTFNTATQAALKNLDFTRLLTENALAINEDGSITAYVGDYKTSKEKTTPTNSGNTRLTSQAELAGRAPRYTVELLNHDYVYEQIKNGIDPRFTSIVKITDKQGRTHVVDYSKSFNVKMIKYSENPLQNFVIDLVNNSNRYAKNYIRDNGICMGETTNSITTLDNLKIVGYLNEKTGKFQKELPKGDEIGSMTSEQILEVFDTHGLKIDSEKLHAVNTSGHRRMIVIDKNLGLTQVNFDINGTGTGGDGRENHASSVTSKVKKGVTKKFAEYVNTAIPPSVTVKIFGIGRETPLGNTVGKKTNSKQILYDSSGIPNEKIILTGNDEKYQKRKYQKRKKQINNIIELAEEYTNNSTLDHKTQTQIKSNLETFSSKLNDENFTAKDFQTLVKEFQNTYDLEIKTLKNEINSKVSQIKKIFKHREEAIKKQGEKKGKNKENNQNKINKLTKEIDSRMESVKKLRERLQNIENNPLKKFNFSKRKLNDFKENTIQEMMVDKQKIIDHTNAQNKMKKFIDTTLDFLENSDLSDPNLLNNLNEIISK